MHRFVRSVATLQSGYIVLNIIQAGAGVLLARILGPEQFGIFTLAMGMAALSSALVGIGIQDVGPTLLGEAYAKRDRQAILEIIGFILRILVIIAILVIAVAMILPVIAQHWYGNGEIGFFASIILLASLFSSSLFSLAYMAYQVVGRVKTMMSLSIFDQLTRFGLSVALAFAGLGVIGASLGHLMGAVLVFVASIFILKKIHRRHEMFPSLPELYRSLTTAKLARYLRFGISVTVDRNIAMLFSILPVILTGSYVSTTEVAYFKIAFAYIMLALSLLGPISVLLSVEFPKTKVEDMGKLHRNFWRVSLYSLGLSVLLSAAAALASPWALQILYGSAYLPSVKYVYGLFVFGALFGIGVGLGPMWRAINRVRVSIIINLITLGLGIPLGLLMIKQWGVWGSVTMVTLWFTLSHLVSFLYLNRKLESLSRH